MKLKVIMGAASIQDWKNHIQELTASDEYREMMVELDKLVSN